MNRRVSTPKPPGFSRGEVQTRKQRQQCRLAEEVGEAAKAALEAQFGQSDIVKYRDEMVQVAAVALAAVEAFDRNKWR